MRFGTTILPRWTDRVETPRKWLWLPDNGRIMTITGKNIGNKKELQTELPSIYGIIADFIETTDDITIPTKQKKMMVMELCNDLNLFVDPHYPNFVFRRNPKTDTIKIVIIDTEHFPSVVGLKKKTQFHDHVSWYLYLANKCFQDTYLRTKQARRAAQTAPHELALI